MNIFGDRLRILRLKKDLSVSSLAERLGVSPSTYREWEYGRSIKGEPYCLLAEILGVSLSELLTGERPSIDEELRKAEEIIQNIRKHL